MRRRDFLATAVAAGCSNDLLSQLAFAADASTNKVAACCGPTYASPADAIASPRETLVYVTALPAEKDSSRPDYLATVDVDPKSSTYGTVVHRVLMPQAGDELHHFGWNACSSCHAQGGASRRYIVLPGLRSGRIHILDAVDRATPKMHKVIEPAEVAKKANLSAPHTVHCLPNGQVMLSMLGDSQGNAPGGFLLLDQEFEIVGRWESQDSPLRFNYDFWYQPRHNVMVSSEWASLRTFQPGFQLDDVKAGKYGSRLYFWDWKTKELIQEIELGAQGMIPLEVRFHHDPASTHGFVGAALSSVVWHWHRPDSRWQVDKVIEVAPVETKGWPFAVPGLITDQLLSLDDRYLYFSNWLHGDIRQYDIRDPAHPKLVGQVWCGGVIGKEAKFRDRLLGGGPQMLQLSLDGKRLYVTNSLYSSWDNQFYPKMAEAGSYMLQVDCDSERGGLKINEDFYVDFGREPGGPAGAHEMRFPGGDSTSDIWV